MNIFGRRFVHVAAAFVALVLSVMVDGEAQAAPAKPPVACRMGVFVISLSQVDTATGTFKADFWMWSVCPTRDLEPLRTVEFLNGVETRGSLDSMIQRGDKWWATRKFTGTFRQDFSLANYPFDQEPLLIDLEEGVLDSRDLIYVADKAQSGMDPAVDLPGWRLKDFSVVSSIARHPTTYGDPSLPGGTSQYAALTLRVGVERAHVANFVKATFPLYIAALLALVGLLVTDGRMGLLGATMFSVVLSFVSLERVVGPHDGVYLLDKLHFATLALILGATGWGVWSMRVVMDNPDRQQDQRRRDVKAAGVLLVGYVLLNLVLIGLAISNSSG